jgi:isocitrate/isopropylmalate dehydrogenase
MEKFDLSVIPGDGIGKEVVPATLEALTKRCPETLMSKCFYTYSKIFNLCEQPFINKT